eukprot:CAMPEP_0113633390 /NCGR_PEP_ID=MMETSP0017_2-20120614/17376_1 /TAXON_ID=2856 /ORGANISM="Cylindrotheca closterium" /LENGTH=301 /DNA_ID=CAMNT_0000544025 /DNA_START=70 /DNA_END=975 /DNA_ORIENTATION=+ /assembly_acc=CAM_ASM_000147
MTRLAAVASLILPLAFGFAPSRPHVSISNPAVNNNRGINTSLEAAASNPFKSLPWNVEKEKNKKARMLKLERSKLHRELGIAEDASYEEVVEATDRLIARAGDDLKRKIKIEVAKDKILQIRLNERLAGLAAASTEARAQSTFEVDGADEEAVATKDKDTEWQAPRWTQGLIVKPDDAQRNGQARLWGGITLAGLLFPPAIDYLNRFTWLVCIAQLSFRGMPRDNIEGGGLGISFNSGGGGKSHMKVAWLLGVGVSILGATLVYGLMPAWAKGQRYTALLAYTLRNTIFAVACSYIQPYKG